MEREIQALKKQKSCVKGKLTKIANFAKSATNETTLPEIQSRIDRCHALMTEFTDFDMKILHLDPQEDGDLTFEDDYHMTVAMLTTLARKKSVSEHVIPPADNTLFNNFSLGGQNCESDLKLPKLNIPKFAGNYTEWPSFFDLYTKTIHESKKLSAAQKLQYLKCLLEGEAASLLRHMLVTENNYTVALAKLQDRYDRKRHIVNAFIRKFIDQPVIQHSTASNLKRIMDTSDEVVRGLEALGSNAEARDPWLIYLLLEKLDDKTRSAWANHSTEMENPQITDFLTFLSRRIDAFETTASTSRRSGSKFDARSHTISQAEPSVTDVHPESLQYRCAYCSNQGHSVMQCQEFIALNPTKRREFIRDKYRCYNCLSKSHSVSRCPSRGRCRECNQRHHTLLHGAQTVSSLIAANDEVDLTSSQEETQSVSAICSITTQCLAVLPTVSLKVINSTGGISPCRALLDSGSQVSLITNSCVQRLNLIKQPTNIAVSGVGQSTVGKTKGSVQLKLVIGAEDTLDIVAYILPRITSRLPTQRITLNMDQLESVPLADPLFNKPSEVDILIGSDVFFETIRNGTKRIKNSPLHLQNTVFGWVVAGRNQVQDKTTIEQFAFTATVEGGLLELDATLKRFWEVEAIGDGKPIHSPEEQLCEDHFVKNSTRTKNGRFVVKLPFKSPLTTIGKSLTNALRRFHALESRLSQNPEFKQLYIQFMNDYISLGHMSEISNPHTALHSYYLPHHGVLKSTDAGSKLRVVFDGSAQPPDGNSLNSCLAVGPTVQASLFAILVRFREKKYVFSTDVEKMYRQIRVAECDTDFQRIIWRESPASVLKHYRLQTVTYGLASSPFLATRALNQIAIDVADQHPNISSIINECVYVDDIMTGADTLSETLTTRNELMQVLSQYGFELKKWQTNCDSLLQDIPLDHREGIKKPLAIEHTATVNVVKILGVCWDPENDNIMFNVHLPQHDVHTKRTALSDASRLFDPVGWLAPVVVRMKIFVQQLWMKNLGWDDALPDNLKTEWCQLRDDLVAADSVFIPRYICTAGTSIVDIHGFSDASKLAYAAVVYFKVCNGNDATVRLIAAKTKVAPIKQLSIPKLELSGALLLSQLMELVIRETRVKVNQIHAWTDSKDVLDWLSDHPSKWSTFVGNRSAEILNILPRACWRHVPSEFNPADCASRGMSPQILQTHSSWWHGPHWLTYSSDRWPLQHNQLSTAIELHVNLQTYAVPLHNIWLDQIIEKFSSFHKLQLVIGYVMRFINNARTIKLKRVLDPILQPSELLSSLNMVCKYEQQQFFRKEIAALRNGLDVHKCSSLAALNPFMDESSLLRVGGRLRNSNQEYDTKHPIIVHPNSNITWLIMNDFHIRYKHAGPSLLVSVTRQLFWIPAAKSKAKTLVRKCVTCQRNKATLRTQLMADLPNTRVTAARPFENCGVDYAGPFNFHLAKGRGQRTLHGYVCLFVCLTVKAVHIEFATDLTSDCFLAAFKRFVARRGVPTNMFSDNGRNFVGAEAKLNKQFHNVVHNSADFFRFSTERFVKWHFNPPQAPHFGGLWEAAVKSTKFHLKRVVGDTILTLEEIVTLLTEVEAILNSRPLCSTTDPTIDMLTPSHFLLGHSNVKVPEKDLLKVQLSHLSRWQHLQKMGQHFWERWHLEYLTSLQTRNKWRSIKEAVNVNDVVIIHEKHIPSCKWPLGRVVEIHPGPDGQVRVVTVKTANGMLQRPIHKLCVLPVSRNEREPPQTTESEHEATLKSTSPQKKREHTNNAIPPRSFCSTIASAEKKNKSGSEVTISSILSKSNIKCPSLNQEVQGVGNDED